MFNMKVRNPNKICQYILKCDRELPKEEQTIFHYRPAGLEDQYSTLGDAVTIERDAEGGIRQTMSMNKEGEINLLLNCITQIDNLKDEEDTLLVWGANKDKNKEILSVIGGEFRVELTEIIRTGVELTDVESKN